MIGIRTVAALGAVLLAGCHARFAREAAGLDAVTLSVSARDQPSVRLSRAAHTFGPTRGMMVDAYDLSQFSREAQLTRIVARKVDPDQAGAALLYGVREALGPGPPFAAVDEAPARIALDVRSWGLEVVGFPQPAAVAYRVRITGTLADGSRFYRARFRCTGDAGPARWIDAVPFGTRDLAQLDAVPDQVVQETFDKAAYPCGRQLAALLRRHAG